MPTSALLTYMIQYIKNIPEDALKENIKTFTYIAAAFLLLCTVSLYRQLSMRYIPADPLRPFIVYAVYMLLMGAWMYSLKSRITQKSMLMCLRLESAVMIFWLTVRLLQDAFFYKNIHVMRVSGYLIVFPLVVTTLFGMYAAFGLGRGESYTLPRSLYLLLIPDSVLVLLMLTNEKHHIVFRVLPGEGENLYFHANIGIIIILLAGTALIVFRMLIIYWRTHQIRERLYLKALPLFVGIAMPLIVLPYFISGFVVEHELIELTAKLYFLEAMSWESCIILGLVPVNTQYGMVFEQSTVGMRIVNEQGVTQICSSHARELTNEQLRELKSSSMISDGEGHEMHLHPIGGGYLVYQNDLSQIYSVISELNQTAAELEQEGELLREELRARSEEASIAAKNQIYDRLTGEVGRYLDYMTELLESSADTDRGEMLRRLCLVGTYVKRRCNLRLIELESGTIGMEELRLSLSDIVKSLELLGVSTKLVWEPTEVYSADYALYIFDSAADRIEKNSSQLAQFDIYAQDKVRIYVRRKDENDTEGEMTEL